MLLCQLHILQCMIAILQIRIRTCEQGVGISVIGGIFKCNCELVNRVVVLPLRKKRVSQAKMERAIVGGEFQGSPIFTDSLGQHVLSPISGRANHVNIP